MKIIRTNKFNKYCKKEKVKNSDIEKLELELSENPARGSIISGTGGLRKVRIAFDNSGKSGSGRVIYYHILNNCIFLFHLYKKGTKENISEEEKKILKKSLETLKKELKARLHHE